MARIALILALILSGLSFQNEYLYPEKSMTDANLRGISVVPDDRVAWASGSKGTVLRILPGNPWQKLAVPGAENLDFRDIQAFDDKTAYVLAAGPGDQSRIYKTEDGGQRWQLQFTNQEPKAFYDCMAFWDRNHGIAVSDAVDGKFLLLSTSDGKTWTPLHPRTLPAALPNEGAFAASGTCLVTFGKRDAWFATGGPAARVFHTYDRGQTWNVATTPVLSGEASQGIFSVLFWSERDGVIVGGDYKKPELAERNAAVTSDSGKTWTLASKPPSGYRSAVARATFSAFSSPPVLIAVGINGADASYDGGKTWTPIAHEEYNAISLGTITGWLVGPQGRMTVRRIPLRK